MAAIVEEALRAGALGFSTVAHDAAPRRSTASPCPAPSRPRTSCSASAARWPRWATASSSSRRPAPAARRPATSPDAPRGRDRLDRAAGRGDRRAGDVPDHAVARRPRAVAPPARRVAASPRPTGTPVYPQVALPLLRHAASATSRRANPFRTRPTYQALRRPAARGPGRARCATPRCGPASSPRARRPVDARGRWRRRCSRRCSTALFPLGDAAGVRADGRARASPRSPSARDARIEDVAYDLMLAARRPRAAATSRCSTTATATTTRSTR